MTTDARRPILSAQGKKAFEAFRDLPFNGNGYAEDMRVALALCTMFNMEYLAQDHLVPNRALPEYATTEAAVDTFMDGMHKLEEYMRHRREAFDIRHMPVVNQHEAKEHAAALIKTLTDEVREAFPAEYANAQHFHREEEWRRV